MQYLDCPRCHASFHTGTIYEAREFCPRCGAPFLSSTPRRGGLRGVLRRSPPVELPDWEAITESQYLDSQGPRRSGR
jgi:ribosomal protein S27AE